MAFVVFAGQSNMGGPGVDVSALWPAWRPDALTRIWDANAHAWVELRPGFNAGYANLAGVWGPEVAFAVLFRARFPDEPLHIVKSVHGGTGLAHDPGALQGDWSPSSRDELFDGAAALVREASSSLGGVRPDVVFFGQGEADAGRAEAAAAYGQNLSAFFAAVRATWTGVADSPIGFFRIGDTPPFAAQVREAQAAVDAADPRAASFDTLGLPRQSDSLHLDPLGLDLVGQGFFRQFLAWRGHETPPAGQTLVGSWFADVQVTGPGADTLSGLWGADFMRGGEGDDVLSGGDGFDDMHGNQGADTLAGQADGDWVVGGKDDDRLSGDGGDDIVLGNLGRDLCAGGEGADIVRGGQDDDHVSGGAGDDWLSGDRGNDTVSGGGGADLFNIFAEAGLERIVDFSAAEGDRVRVEGASSWSVAQVGADTVVTLAGGAQMVLVGVSASALGSGWIFGA